MDWDDGIGSDCPGLEMGSDSQDGEDSSQHEPVFSSNTQRVANAGAVRG